MPVGSYGILRALGIKEKKAITYLKILDKANNLLFVRGYVNELNIPENELKNMGQTG